MKYRVLDVINKHSGLTADKFSSIGREATTEGIVIETKAVLHFEDTGKYLSTSIVLDIEQDGDILRVETMNTVYVLEVVE
jgi:hypothetical protein